MKIRMLDKITILRNKLYRFILMKKQGYDNKHGYSLIKDSKTMDIFESIKSGSDFIKQADSYDSFGYISRELGKNLEKHFMDDDYVIGIHRTGETIVTKDLLKDIFSNGLINAGKTIQTGTGNIDSSSFDIENTVSIFSFFTHLISQIKGSHGYKSSDGCIILKIPKCSIGLNSNTPIPLYQIKNGKCYIRTEFIYGYVPVDFKGNVGDLVFNPNFNEHDNQNKENYVYDNTVLKNAKEILLRNYELTYNKYDKKQADVALVNFLMKNNVSFFTGENNRKLLSSRIDIYNSLKRLEYPNGIQIGDIQLIIDDFNSKINEQKNNGITK